MHLKIEKYTHELSIRYSNTIFSASHDAHYIQPPPVIELQHMLTKSWRAFKISIFLTFSHSDFESWVEKSPWSCLKRLEKLNVRKYYISRETFRCIADIFIRLFRRLVPLILLSSFFYFYWHFWALTKLFKSLNNHPKRDGNAFFTVAFLNNFLLTMVSGALSPIYSFVNIFHRHFNAFWLLWRILWGSLVKFMMSFGCKKEI